MKNNKIMNVY